MRFSTSSLASIGLLAIFASLASAARVASDGQEMRLAIRALFKEEGAQANSYFLFRRSPVKVDFGSTKWPPQQAAIQTAVDHHQAASYPAMTKFNTNDALHVNPKTGDPRLHVTGKAYDATGQRIDYTSTVNGQVYSQHHVPLAPGQVYTDKKGVTYVGRRMEHAEGVGRIGLVAW